MSRSKSLYLAQDMTEPEVLQQFGGNTVVFSTRCPGKATSNEDSAAVIVQRPDSGVLVVADGMGGGAAGEQASRIAVESIEREIERESDNGLVLRSSILNGIESANQQVLDLGIGAATTLAVVEIQDGVIRPYHVGDSCIIVVGQRGKVKLQTVAHSPVSFAVEAGVLDDDEAMRHEDRHLVSNVLGATDMRIEIGPAIRLSRFDTLLLASDGLFDNLSVDEIVDGIRKGPLVKAVTKIIEGVQRRMGNTVHDTPSKPDDMTMIAFRLAGVS